jgi:hypothetical protein
MKNFQEIMSGFFEDLDIAFDIFGKEDADKQTRKVKTLFSNKNLIISNIRPNVNAVITLEENGHSEKYEGFGVKIIHKDNGRIDGQWFGFKDYMPHNCQLGLEKEKRPYSIIGYVQNGNGWYGSAPEEHEIRPMFVAIMKYIGTWV